MIEKDYYDQGNKADQSSAQYNALGATENEACANCLFFISPNCCSVVQDWPVPISPTGHSKYWTAIPVQTQEPLRVIVVAEPEDEEEDGGMDMGEMSKIKFAGNQGKPMNLFDRLVAAVKSAVFSPGSVAPAEPGRMLPPTGDDSLSPAGAFRLYKEQDGAYRWLALVSNKYRDRDNKENGPEIIEEAAHKEYVAYLDKTGDYPEAWLWHTPGTKWGRADWADYADGFLLMSGTVEKGMEDVAAALEGEHLGVSHGFYQRYSDQKKGIIGWYRTFEVSALPPEAAANPWTALTVIQKEAGMALDERKRAFIVGKLGAQRVTDLEGDLLALGKALEAAGVEYKDLLAAGAGVDTTADVAEKSDAATLSLKDVADTLEKALAPTVTAITTLGASVAAMDARLKTLEKGTESQLVELLTAKSSEARRAGAGGYQASKEGGVAEKDDDLKGSGPATSKEQNDWLRTALGSF